jgi:holo-[acyl-carrier protein] synthase
MILGNGIDLVDLARIRDLIRRQGERFLDRVFTAAEIAHCRPRVDADAAFAARFAAKEAVMKCLGTGWSDGIGFQQIEVLRAPRGSVSIGLRGRAADVAAAQGIRRIHLSLSHTATHAVASAVAEGE